jgi:hypothetical protein
MEGTLHRQKMYSSDDRIRGSPDSTELMNTTPFALDVLAQGTQGTEPCMASIQRAQIKLVLMAWTPEMLVKGRERPIRSMAQVALIGVPVPG